MDKGTISSLHGRSLRNPARGSGRALPFLKVIRMEMRTTIFPEVQVSPIVQHCQFKGSNNHGQSDFSNKPIFTLTSTTTSVFTTSSQWHCVFGDKKTNSITHPHQQFQSKKIEPRILMLLRHCIISVFFLITMRTAHPGI